MRLIVCFDDLLANIISELAEFDSIFAIADDLIEFGEASSQEGALIFMVFDAVHEKTSELQWIKTIFFAAIDVFDALQQVFIHHGNEV